MKKLLFLIPLLFSCTSNYLIVQSDYITVENLASYYVGSPDPKLNCPPQGQRIVIKWTLPPIDFSCDDVQLILTYRLKTREEKTVVYPLRKRKGLFIFELLNVDYFQSGGIVTYKVDLIAGDQVLEQWRHQLWVDLIVIHSDEST